MELCRDLHRENGLFPMSDEKVRNTVRLAFAKKGGIVGVIGVPGKIEALIYLLIVQHWSSDEWHLEELFLYCKPEYRKSNNTRALMKFSDTCAKELGLPLTIGVISNKNTEDKVEMYERYFGKKAGAFFVTNSLWQTDGGAGRTPQQLELDVYYAYRKLKRAIKAQRESGVQVDKWIKRFRKYCRWLEESGTQGVTAMTATKTRTMTVQNGQQN